MTMRILYMSGREGTSRGLLEIVAPALRSTASTASTASVNLPTADAAMARLGPARHAARGAVLRGAACGLRQPRRCAAARLRH